VADAPPAPASIREFSPEHMAGALALIVSTQQGEFSIPITLQDQPDLLDIPRFYQAAGGNFWVAVGPAVPGTLGAPTVIGTIALMRTSAAVMTLRKMFVAPPYRGREHGVAAALLATAVAWAAARGITDIYLGTIEVFRAAHRFYEKSGFVRVAKAELPGAFPAMTVDNVFYHLRLNARG
jgi:GNAT superfamily N-acetyltransferase